MIKRHKKVCKVCGNERYLFSGGMCLYCHRVNKGSNKPNKTLRRKSGYKIPPRKKRSGEGIKQGLTNFGFKSQVEVMEYLDKKLREDGKLFCFLTGKQIHCEYKGEMWLQIWAHVLPKGKYTYWKLNPDNYRPLLPYVHNLVDNFKEEYFEEYSEIDFERWFALQEKMKKEYVEFKNKYLL